MKMTLYILSLCLLVGCKLTQLTKKVYKDPRDGNKYGYVEIDDDYWMTENMRYNLEGSLLNPANPDSIFGRLYDGYQALEVCPEGWNLTDTYDWVFLEKMMIQNKEKLYKMDQFRGNGVYKFKSKQYWNTPGTDSLGLNLVPAGVYFNWKKDYHNLGTSAFFWTSTHEYNITLRENMEKVLEYRYIHNDSSGMYYSARWKTDAYQSCRCVKSMTKEEIAEREERLEKLAKRRERQEKRKNRK